jgi:hypothetical protein
MLIGISGHQRLVEDSWWDWVRSEIESIIDREEKPIMGISSLAIGADQLFARLVLEMGGTLYAVLPFQGYERTFQTADALKQYRELLQRATSIETLSSGQADDEERFLAAGRRVVDLCQKLIVVWNAEPAKGLGGTADVVAYALTTGRPIIHINPATHGVTDL